MILTLGSIEYLFFFFVKRFFLIKKRFGLFFDRYDRIKIKLSEIFELTYNFRKDNRRNQPSIKIILPQEKLVFDNVLFHEKSLITPK